MLSTFGAFESARSGLSVAMQQLNVTEQNIANVNTEGYTRQRLLTSAKEPGSSAYLIAQLNKTNVGQGVTATGIQQIRSSYLDQQYRNLNTGYNYSSNRSDALKYLTGLYNELNDDSSMSIAISGFFSALNTFTSDPSSQEYRTNVQQKAASMTESFQNVYEEMQSLWEDQNGSMEATAIQINSVAEKLADLNDLIAKSVQAVGTANDLEDQRNLLLDELSGYANITYSKNASNPNMINVSIGGLALVTGNTFNQIGVDSASDHQADIDTLLTQIAGYNSDPVANAADLTAAQAQLQAYGNFTFTTNGTGGTDVALGGAALVSETSATTVGAAAGGNLSTWVELKRNNLTLAGSALSIESGTLTGGKLYSSMELAVSQSDTSPGIPSYMKQLNTFVQDMAKNINTIHQSGWTYPDGSTASQTGINFFKVPSHVDGTGTTVYDYDKLNAGSFALSDEVAQSVFNIAGSSAQIVLSGDSPESGNNIIASQLSKDLTISQYKDKLHSIVLNLAIASNTSDSILSTRKSLLGSVDTQRQSISAVSLDEETTNLIIFQQAYNAAARVITTLDDMLNTLINKMGIT